MAELGVAVGGEVVSGQAVAHQLALQEHHLVRGCLFDLLAVDSGGLVHGIGLAVGGVNIDVLAVVPAVPVLVLLQAQSLAGLEGDQLVGAVGAGGLHAGVIGGGLLILVQALVVQVGLDQPVGGQGVQQVEAGQALGQGHGDLVVAGLVQANVLEGNLSPLLSVDQVHRQGGAIGLAPGFVAGDQSGQGVQGLVGQGDNAVSGLVGGQGLVLGNIEVLLAVVVNKVLQDIATQLLAGNAQSNIDLLAVGVHILAVLTLGQVGDGVGVGLIGGGAALGVALGVGNAHALRIVVGSTVVQHFRIQQTLHGFHVVVSGDGGAVFPAGVGVQVDGVGVTGGRALGNAELGMILLDLLGHIHRLAGGHLRHELVAGEGGLHVALGVLNGIQLVVEDEGVEADLNEILQIGIVIGLVGVGIPVGGQQRNGSLIGISCVFRCSGCFGSGSGRGGLGALVGAAGEHGNDHQHSQKQCECSFHFITSNKISIKTDVSVS